MSEYVRNLISDRRQEQIKADLALLERAIKCAPLGDPSEEKMADIYARRKKKHEGRL